VVEVVENDDSRWVRDGITEVFLDNSGEELDVF
jgi:hypothetical protein